MEFENNPTYIRGLIFMHSMRRLQQSLQECQDPQTKEKLVLEILEMIQMSAEDPKSSSLTSVERPKYVISTLADDRVAIMEALSKMRHPTNEAEMRKMAKILEEVTRNYTLAVNISSANEPIPPLMPRTVQYRPLIMNDSIPNGHFFVEISSLPNLQDGQAIQMSIYFANFNKTGFNTPALTAQDCPFQFDIQIPDKVIQSPTKKLNVDATLMSRNIFKRVTSSALTSKQPIIALTEFADKSTIKETKNIGNIKVGLTFKVRHSLSTPEFGEPTSLTYHLLNPNFKHPTIEDVPNLEAAINGEQPAENEHQNIETGKTGEEESPKEAEASPKQSESIQKPQKAKETTAQEPTNAATTPTSPNKAGHNVSPTPTHEATHKEPTTPASTSEAADKETAVSKTVNEPAPAANEDNDEDGKDLPEIDAGPRPPFVPLEDWELQSNLTLGGLKYLNDTMANAINRIKNAGKAVPPKLSDQYNIIHGKMKEMIIKAKSEDNDQDAFVNNFLDRSMEENNIASEQKDGSPIQKRWQYLAKLDEEWFKKLSQ